MRARITFTVDEPTKLIIIRYVGHLDGPQVNESLIEQYKALERCWEYDNLIDLRRFEGLVLAADIEDLGQRWEALAQGRDKGQFSAIVSDDVHVHARFAITQAAFPNRTMAAFGDFDEGLDWLSQQRQAQRTTGPSHA